MKGLLIYDTASALRNKWFIGEFLSVSKQLNIELNLVIVDQIDDFLLEKGVSFAIVRTINPPLQELLEKNGILTFNDYNTAFIANDKFETYLFAKKLNLPVLETKIFSLADNKFHFPFVVKKRNGHGGSEVFLVKNHLDLENLVNKIKANGDNLSEYISQPLASNIGVDTRHYVLGGEILLSVKRSSKTDFRSNFSLGGECEVVLASDKEKEIIAKIYSSLKCHFVGVDIIIDNGKLILNEIEDVVGTRMIYKLSKINVVEKYLTYILNSINKNN